MIRSTPEFYDNSFHAKGTIVDMDYQTGPDAFFGGFYVYPIVNFIDQQGNLVNFKSKDAYHIGFIFPFFEPKIGKKVDILYNPEKESTRIYDFVNYFGIYLFYLTASVILIISTTIKKNSLKKILILSLSGSLFIIFAAFLYDLNSVSLNRTELLKYSNKEFNFELKYPKEFLFREERQPNGGSKFSITISKDDCQKVQAAYCGEVDVFWVDILEKGAKEDLLAKNKILDICHQKAKIENYQNGISYTLSWDQVFHPGVCNESGKEFNPNDLSFIREIYLPHKSRVFRILISYNKNTEAQKRFDEVLSSFKFLE